MAEIPIKKARISPSGEQFYPITHKDAVVGLQSTVISAEEAGSGTTADFNAQSDTVWNKPQVLSNAQKQQARENIGAQESIPASRMNGWDNKAENIRTVNHGTSDTVYELTPNVLHVWDVVPSLNLSLGAEEQGVINIYAFRFVSGSTPTTLALPQDVVWASEPDIQADKVYEVSIMNGLATYISNDTGTFSQVQADWNTSNQNLASYIKNKPDLTVKENRMGIETVSGQVSTLACIAGKYYRFDSSVSTLAVTLPAVTNATYTEVVMLSLTTGASSNITFASADGKPIAYYDSYDVDSNTSYEFSCLYDGTKWVIANSEIVIV